MDAEQRGDGRWHFALGVVEKWVVTLVAGAVVVGLAAASRSVTTRLDKLSDAQVELAKSQSEANTKQAVTNQQLATLNLQLANLPALTTQMAEAKVRLDRHDEDIKELRQVRGLR